MLWRKLGDAGIIEQGINLAKPGRGRDNRLAALFFADTGLDQNGFGTSIGNEARCVFGLILAAGIIDDHGLSTPAGCLNGNRPAKACRRAGHNNH